jgi:hypothetical protein
MRPPGLLSNITGRIEAAILRFAGMPTAGDAKAGVVASIKFLI